MYYLLVMIEHIYFVLELHWYVVPVHTNVGHIIYGTTLVCSSIYEARTIYEDYRKRSPKIFLLNTCFTSVFWQLCTEINYLINNESKSAMLRNR